MWRATLGEAGDVQVTVVASFCGAFDGDLWANTFLYSAGARAHIYAHDNNGPYSMHPTFNQSYNQPASQSVCQPHI